MKAFSLIELLVTVAILGILTAAGMRFYNEQRESSVKTWAKAEMIEISKFMKMAQAEDGYYHQFIYAMGYQPKGAVLASVGTDASHNQICCSEYPNPGADPCSIGFRSGFLYYNCKTSSLHTATDNIEICEDSAYELSCDKKSDNLKALKTGDFTGGCSPQPAAWCDCASFTIAAKTYLGAKFSLDEGGKFCE